MISAAAQRPSTPLDALLQQLRPFSDYRDPRYDLEHCLSTLSDYVESATDLSAYDRVRVWNTMGMLAFDHAPADSQDHDRALAYQPGTPETEERVNAWLDTYGPLFAETEFAPEIDRLKAEVDRILRRESGH